MVKIGIRQLIKSNFDHEDGSRLYHAIKSALKDSEVVELDFYGVEIVTSSFLNTSFRILLSDYEYDSLKSRLKIINTNPSINKMIKGCIDSVLNAKTQAINKDQLL